MLLNSNQIKIIACTTFALLAFAANSVLCRLALDENAIDAASFTVIRLISGIIVLISAVIISDKSSQSSTKQDTKQSTETKTSQKSKSKGSWLSAAMLFIYAVAFSFGYISLDTGTGALILFGAVQITMILAAMLSGSKLHFSEIIGLIIAFSGFVYLIIPTVATPSLTGFVLMTISGVAWALYTLKGKASKSPLNDTAYNFLKTSPFVLALIVFGFSNAHITIEGAILAVLSGAIASGVGYLIWYIALAGISVTQAAVVQLFVPVLAALGGVVFSSELITFRLINASVLVLGGVLIVTLGNYYFVKSAQEKARII